MPSGNLLEMLFTLHYRQSHPTKVFFRTTLTRTIQQLQTLTHNDDDDDDDDNDNDNDNDSDSDSDSDNQCNNN